MPTDLQNAIREAAEAFLAHGGPECRTDPHISLDAMGRVRELGGTDEDVTAEMKRIRTQRGIRS